MAGAVDDLQLGVRELTCEVAPKADRARRVGRSEEHEKWRGHGREVGAGRHEAGTPAIAREDGADHRPFVSQGWRLTVERDAPREEVVHPAGCQARTMADRPQLAAEHPLGGRDPDDQRTQR